ncbi:MAG: SDR family NAD(P)-dependent oxidoreductase [Chitinophagaceae bacterium]|nr:SDR family NAD(P)-dependent oxidoreductase [Rubrivivax sp.]
MARASPSSPKGRQRQPPSSRCQLERRFLSWHPCIGGPHRLQGREMQQLIHINGAPVVDNTNTQTPGPRGPALLQDIWLLEQLDLASLESVRDCADQLLADSRRFDVIIANAGVMATPFGRTTDGFEIQFGTNHLGHFALISRIQPLLVDGGRLVVLSSQAHRVADVDLEDPNFERQAYEPFVAYGRSKSANALFAVEFDRRHRDRGIRAASVMPGNSLTDLARHFSQQELQGPLEAVDKARADAGLEPKALKDIAQAAATPVWAAVVANGEEIGGRYLDDCAVAPIDDTANPFANGVMSYALDTTRAKQLWARSEELIRAAS